MRLVVVWRRPKCAPCKRCGASLTVHGPDHHVRKQHVYILTEARLIVTNAALGFGATVNANFEVIAGVSWKIPWSCFSDMVWMLGD